MRPSILTFVLLSACSPRPQPLDSVTGADPHVVAVVAFTEGPTTDADGNVYFTETRGERILKFTPGKGVTTFRENSNAANGLIFDSQWRLIACEGGTRPRVSRTDLPTGKIEILVETYEGQPLGSPNDVTVDSKGRIYFTDYRGKSIYRIDPDGKLARLLTTPQIEVPNGIVIS